MNAAEIRRSFAEFCGVDRYREFVAAIWGKAMPKGRLVFWQDRLWREFGEASAAALPASFAEVRRVFQVCPRHLEPLETLEPDRVSAVAAPLGGVPEDDRLALFPFAFVRSARPGGLTEALSCPACRSELAARGAVARPHI